MERRRSTEPLLTLAEAARLDWLPRRRRGARPQLSTLLRWVRTGYAGIRLHATRVGNSWCVTESALHASFDAIAAESQSADRVGERRRALPLAPVGRVDTANRATSAPTSRAVARHRGR